ncbi:MAG: phage tail tube protein [Myxococcota bacterium]
MAGEGYGTALQIGKESDYGTAVTLTGEVPLYNPGEMHEVVERVSAQVLNMGGNSYSREFVNQGVVIESSAEFPLMYEGMGFLLEAFLADTPSTTGSTSPYTHEYRLGSTHPSYTVGLIRGQTGSDETFSGWFVRGGQIAFRPRQIARLRLDYTARQATGARGLISPIGLGGTIQSRAVYGREGIHTNSGLGFSVQVLTNDMGTTYHIEPQELILSINHGIAREDRVDDGYCAGIRRTGRTVVTVTMRVPFTADIEAIYDRYRSFSNETNDWELSWTWQKSSNVEMQWALFEPSLVRMSQPISGPGRQSVTLTFESSTGDVRLRLKNTQSSYSAN